MVEGKAGKGDRYRRVDRKKYYESYDRIFGSKETKDSQQTECPQYAECQQPECQQPECQQCLGSGVFAGKACTSCKGKEKE